MLRVLTIIVISIVIFVCTYKGFEKNKLTKAVIFSGLVAVLGFAGPYIVEFVGTLDENRKAENTNSLNDESSVRHEHEIDSNNRENIIDASCLNEGCYELVSYCKCGEELERETIIVDMLGHNYTKSVTSPSCDESGFTTYKCARCQDSYMDNFAEALGHDLVNGICLRCEAVDPEYEAIVIPQDSVQSSQETVNAVDYTAANVIFTTFNGAIDGKDQENIYSIVAPTSGDYRFTLSEMVNGFNVKLYITDSAGNRVGGYSGIGNNQGSTCSLEKGCTYSIAVMSYSGVGNYTLTVGQPKEIVEVTSREVVHDSIEYIDQVNEYTFIPSISGVYRFDLNDMVNGFNVKLYIYDSLGYRVGGYSGVRNGDGATVEMVADAAYTIRVEQYSDLGEYTLMMGKQLSTQDVTEKNMFTGHVTYTDQNNKYIYTPSTSGEYIFTLRNMVSGFNVKFYVYDSLNYRVGGYSGAKNDSEITVDMNAYEEYTIHLIQYSGYGNYEVSISK